jgi:chromosome segregation ATPase
MLLGADGDGAGAVEVAVIGATAAALTGILAVLLPYLLQRRAAAQKEAAEREGREAKVKRDAYDEALAQYRDFVARLEAQVERCDAAAAEARRAVGRLQELNADCREEAAELRQSVRWLYDQLRRLHGAMTAAKLDPGALPEQPRFRERRADEAEFIARTQAQSAALVAEARKDVEASKPTPPGEVPKP